MRAFPPPPIIIDGPVGIRAPRVGAFPPAPPDGKIATSAITRLYAEKAAQRNGRSGYMKFAPDWPWSDHDKAACKLLEIANAVAIERGWLVLQADEPNVITPSWLFLAEAAFEVVPDGVVRVALPFKAGVRSSVTSGATERLVSSAELRRAGSRCRLGVEPGLPPWRPHVRFRRVRHWSGRAVRCVQVRLNPASPRRRQKSLTAPSGFTKLSMTAIA